MIEIQGWARLAAVVATVSGILFPAANANAQSRLMTIATGSVQGVYYAAGGGICRLVNRERATTGLRCINDITQGSVGNVDALARNAANFGIVQSDIHRQVVQGVAPYDRSGLKDELRSVLTLHGESLSVMVGPSVKAADLSSLKAAKVSRGFTGTGSRAAADFALTQAGWSATDGPGAVERVADEQVYALCEGKVDAMFMVIGHPSTIVTRGVKDCGARLLGLDEQLLDRLATANPAWVRAAIPAGTYANQPSALPSVGPVATLVTVASVPDAVVYNLVKAVFDNLAEFKENYPVSANFDPKRMIADGLAAPLHPGAVRYFKERGWL